MLPEGIHQIGPNGEAHVTPDVRSATLLRIAGRGRDALTMLLEAHGYAHEVGRDEWEFAVEISALHSAGLTSSDLRWLVCQGFLAHGVEVTLEGSAVREFRWGGYLTFSNTTCFILAEAGLSFARTLGLHDSFAPQPDYRPTLRLEADEGPIPKWDQQRKELRLGGHLIKQFKLPAANQEMILSAFEEEGWPPRIDDPLPPPPDQDPKLRLHSTINSLNRRHRTSLIRFLGDGNGLGVRWERVAEKPSRSHLTPKVSGI